MSGGTILSSELFIASGSGSTGTMVMTGGTMTLESSFESYVGESGTGSLTMNGAGGLITGTAAFLNVGGAVSSGTGTMTVTTGTVNLTGGSSLEVGNDGSGTLIVNGGYVYADSVTSGSIARITVSSGTLSSNTFTDAPAFNATISLTGSGVLQILSGSMDLGETGGRVNTLNLGAGGAAGTLLVAGVFDEGGAIGTINFNQSGTYSFAPRINGSFNINNVGTGITILGGSNNYTGSTTISAGTLQFAKINSMYVAGTATAASGATLAVNAGGTGEFTNGTSGYGTIGGLFSGLGGEAGSVVSLSTGADIGIDTTNAGGSLTYAGNITNPGIGLTKLGSGALVLTGDNTYTGTTTVASGTLTVNGSIASSPAVVNGGVLNGSGTTGNITVGSGGYLGGTLSSGVVVANAGGTVTAGDAPGANSMTSLTLSGSATYQEQIVVPGGGSYTGPGNHPIAGTDYGQTTLTGSGNAQTVLTLDSANSILQLSVTGSLPAGGVASNAKPYVVGGANSSLDNYFFLTLSNNTDLVSGKFAMVTSDGVNFTGINYTSSNLLGNSSVGTFTLNGQEWAIDYTGNIATNSDTGGNSVVITAIPEPASYVLLAFGGVALAMFERRRKVSEE
jgi:autotransporter-associated beta strand protein